MTEFKFQISKTIANFFRKQYTVENAQKHRESRKYAQKIIKLIKLIEINLVFNQLNIIYNNINVKFKQNFRRFINIITLNKYFNKFYNFKNI